LFELGSGSQVHDYNLGVLPSGLFWTTTVGPDEVDVDDGGRRVELDVDRMIAIDTFQFFAPTAQPAEVRFKVVWEANGPFVARGKGTGVAATDAAAFLGQIAPASSKGRFSGSQLGFAFEGRATHEGGWAQVGTERNGSFLDT
jgi:hypothetical protein